MQVLFLYRLFSIEATLAVFEILDGRTAEDVAARLRQEPQVIDADVNTELETQSDPHAPRQYALEMVGAERAHAALRGRNVFIAVVDAGVDVHHEDLSGAVAAQESLIEGSLRMTADAHGTAVAGIIAARRGNGLGIIGIAPEASLVALQACVPKRPDAVESTCLAHRVTRGVDLAVRHRVQILNMSLGGPPNRVVNRLVLSAIFSHGVMVVAAAGNNGPGGPALYPGALPEVIAVGAADRRGIPYDRSNLGRHVAMLAPGVDVMATFPANRYLFATGTSYAAAHVSGALALLVEASHGLVPDADRDLGTSDMLAALKTGAAGANGLTAGRLDICRSMAVLKRPEVCR